jgi:hypothetical protein
MRHPARILIVAILCEAFVQFSKRALYWVSSSTSIAQYAMLLAGDLVFVGLIGTMLSHLKFQRRHWVLIGLFLCMLLYTTLLSGPAAAILAVRNTYLWILAALLFAVSVEHPIGRGAAKSMVNVTQLLSGLLVVIAIVQVQSDYAFEKPWFKFSGTSLNYDGVTNFGQAAKAFSMMSGPTDFACFGLFALAVGIATRTWSLNLLGAAIIVMSGTRGILIAIPVWAVLAWSSAVYIRRNYLIFVAAFFAGIFVFSDQLITLLYALPNSRFSFATLAPRIELWTNLEPANIMTGGGLAANLSIGSLTNAPTVIDSGLIYLLTEIGGPLTLTLIYVLLTAARHDLLGSRRGALQLFIGVLIVASVAQIPFHTRLSNFLICLLVYAGIHHAKTAQIRRLGR